MLQNILFLLSCMSSFIGHFCSVCTPQALLSSGVVRSAAGTGEN